MSFLEVAFAEDFIAQLDGVHVVDVATKDPVSECMFAEHFVGVFFLKTQDLVITIEIVVAEASSPRSCATPALAWLWPSSRSSWLTPWPSSTWA